MPTPILFFIQVSECHLKSHLWHTMLTKTILAPAVIWVTPHPHCMLYGMQVFLSKYYGCIHAHSIHVRFPWIFSLDKVLHHTHTPIISSLKYGCAHTHDLWPGIVQLCCMFAFWFIVRTCHFFFTHMGWCLVDKVMKLHGGSRKIEGVMTMYKVWAIYHQHHFVKAQ